MFYGWNSEETAGLGVLVYDLLSLFQETGLQLQCLLPAAHLLCIWNSERLVSYNHRNESSRNHNNFDPSNYITVHYIPRSSSGGWNAVHIIEYRPTKDHRRKRDPDRRIAQAIEQILHRR